MIDDMPTTDDVEEAARDTNPDPALRVSKATQHTEQARKHCGHSKTL